MSEITIRQITGDERFEIAYQQTSYAFSNTPPLPDREQRRHIFEGLGESLHVALFEDGDPMASAASSPMQHNIRGQIYPMGGIWGVVTHPSGRRRGFARQMLAQLLADVREQGKPFTTLYPFRESFYHRLGYTIYTQPRFATFSPVALAPLLRRPLIGKMRLMTAEDALPRYHAYLQKYFNRTHGMAMQSDEATKAVITRADVWVALAERDGQDIGMMTYRIREHPSGHDRQMWLWDFVYDDAAARYLMLEWFARHIDQVKDVKVRLHSSEQPETWMPDMEVDLDGIWPPMGRVLDVEKIGGMQTGPGRFTAQINDPICDWNTGVFTFEAVDGCLQVSRATADPDLTLTIQGLSALVYGTHDPAMFVFRNWGDPTPEQQHTLRAMFPPMHPYLREQF